MPRLYTLIIFCLFSLTACFAPIKTSEQYTYTLNPPLTKLMPQRGQLTLLVNTPAASSAYDTNQMAYMTKPYQISYFANNFWIDSPAHMLQSLLVQNLQANFNHVITNSTSSYDFILNTSILQFQQEFLYHPSQVRLAVFAQLLQAKTGKVLASQQFNVLVTTLSDTPYGGVIAANQATALLLQQLSVFCQQTLQAHH